jgi:hypothetical protein
MENQFEKEINLEFGNKRFVIVRDKLIAKHASDYANFKGGCLATIPNEGTNVFLTVELQRAGISSAWIGLNDEGSEGEWVWESGVPYSYKNWASGAPNNRDHDSRGEDHVVLNSQGTWDDYMGYSHGYTFPFIVELP